MSLRKSFLSRRIIHRSFTLSKSYKESKSLEIQSIGDNSNLKEDEKTEQIEEDNRIESHRKNGVVSGESDPSDSGAWSSLLLELLGDIIRRVESSEDKWPQRQNVVVCGCVCKRWREVTKEAVEKASVNQLGKITFPSSLRKAGPQDSPLQCLITRDKKKSTFYLYLALSQSFTEKGKFLLAARRYRNGAHTEYIISLDADDLSQGSSAYVGKLRSDFLGTNFTIYDSHPPHVGAKPSITRSSRRVAAKQISPQIPSTNFQIGQVSYKFNLLKSRGPRRMTCSLNHHTSFSSDQENSINKISDHYSYTILQNKAPRWHEHLECWCLNFHGRVTVASVKNFQLVAGKGDVETVLLQFGKVGDDVFTMDYRQPLSAFQAFAICLTSFGTKLACE